MVVRKVELSVEKMAVKMVEHWVAMKAVKKVGLSAEDWVEHWVERLADLMVGQLVARMVAS
jgi:hypothetical protein